MRERGLLQTFTRFHTATVHFLFLCITSKHAGHITYQTGHRYPQILQFWRRIWKAKRRPNLDHRWPQHFGQAAFSKRFWHTLRTFDTRSGCGYHSPINKAAAARIKKIKDGTCQLQVTSFNCGSVDSTTSDGKIALHRISWTRDLVELSKRLKVVLACEIWRPESTWSRLFNIFQYSISNITQKIAPISYFKDQLRFVSWFLKSRFSLSQHLAMFQAFETTSGHKLSQGTWDHAGEAGEASSGTSR